MSRRSAHAKTASYLRPDHPSSENAERKAQSELPSALPPDRTGTFRRSQRSTVVIHGAPNVVSEQQSGPTLGALQNALAVIRDESAGLRRENERLKDEALRLETQLMELAEERNEAAAEAKLLRRAHEADLERFAELRRTVDALQDRRAFELAALEGARAEASTLRKVAAKAEAAQEGTALAAEHLRHELDKALAAAAQATDERDAGWHLLEVARRELSRAQEQQARLKAMYEAEIDGLRSQRDDAQRVINSQLPPALAEEIPAPNLPSMQDGFTAP